MKRAVIYRIHEDIVEICGDDVGILARIWLPEGAKPGDVILFSENGILLEKKPSLKPSCDLNYPGMSDDLDGG
ncbi:MAG: hypothetical protein HPY81_04875 [Firmicutes bacterium]|nr:hypothetical protein [Bacillota bacterium]